MESEKTTLANPATLRRNKGQGRSVEENGRCYCSVTPHGDLQPKQRRYGPQFPLGDRVPESHSQSREDIGFSFRTFNPCLLGSYVDTNNVSNAGSVCGSELPPGVQEANKGKGIQGSSRSCRGTPTFYN